MAFKTFEEAENYYHSHHTLSDDAAEEEARLERFLESVIIEEREDKEPVELLPSIAELQREAMSRGHSNYPPGFDESLLD